jgi:hypothetical protein
VVPPPPPIDQNPNNGPHPKTAPDRPAAKADVATDSQWQKGDSVAGTFGTAFLQALLDGFGVAFNPSLSDDDSSALSDSDGSGCPGGMLGLQCTASGNLLDPTTGTVYCNPAAGLTPGNTCVPLPDGTGATESAAGQCGGTYCVTTGATPGLVHNSSREVNFAAKQINKKFKHAIDFGVTGNNNNAGRAAFKSAMEEFLDGDGVNKLPISYRGNPATIYVNPTSRLGVLTDPDGNFLSGWQLSEDQLGGVINDRFLF